MEPASPASPALAGRLFTAKLPERPIEDSVSVSYCCETNHPKSVSYISNHLLIGLLVWDSFWLDSLVPLLVTRGSALDWACLFLLLGPAES